MKKHLLLLPLLAMFIPSCSNSPELVTLTTKYMNMDEQNELYESELSFDFFFAFEENYTLTQDDLDVISFSACRYVNSHIVNDGPSSRFNVYGFYFDLETKETLKAGYVMQEDIVVYYSFIPY